MTTKTLETELRTRFNRAITSLSTPAVLIGLKWLRPDPSNKPGAFEFVGVPKIAKALGFPAKRVLQMLLQRVGVEHLGLSTDVTGDLIIRIFPTKTPARELKQPKPPQ